ncbi:unnamed protein product [Effrenium voratum]|nr:unnamed protein product [Effrenium voratum]
MSLSGCSRSGSGQSWSVRPSRLSSCRQPGSGSWQRMTTWRIQMQRIWTRHRPTRRATARARMRRRTQDGKAEPAKDDAEDAGKEPGTGDSEGKPDRKRKRAGKKKSGAQKKREKLEREEQKKEEDEDKWLKLKLAGEEKPRRIAANRIVSYYDFDGRGNPIRFAAGAPRPEVGPMEEDEDFIPGDCLPAPSGNFRANLRPDLWDDSDES